MPDIEPWRVMVAETLTGLIVADVVPTTQPRFDRTISAKGSFSVEVPIAESSRVDLHTYTQSGKYTWLVAYGNYIVQAGPVWTVSINDDTGRLTVDGGGLATLFDKRVLRNPRGSINDPVPSITNPSEDLVYTGLSLRGILAALVRDNLAQDGFELPLDVPEPETGQAERTYYGYDLATAWSRMEQLTGVLNGPEFDFCPYFVPGENRLRWRLDIGGPLLGDQDTDAVWDYGSALGSINVDVDGSQSPAARVWVKGDGSERELKTGYASAMDYVREGFPPLDHVDAEHTSVTEQATLEAYADRALERHARPVETWSCAVRIDGHSASHEVSPALGNWDLGDAPTFFIDQHAWLPSGGYRRRVTGFSSQDASHVALTLAETASQGLGHA